MYVFHLASQVNYKGKKAITRLGESWRRDFMGRALPGDDFVEVFGYEEAKGERRCITGS